MKGPPSRLLKKDQNIQLFSESDRNSKDVRQDLDNKKFESIKMNGVKSSDIKSSETLGKINIQEQSTNAPIHNKKNGKEDITIQENPTQDRTAVLVDKLKEYDVPLREEDEPTRDKKLVTV